MTSLSVVDLTSGTKKGDDEVKKTQDAEVDVEDDLWNELMKCFLKLEIGIEGDLSSLSRCVRMLNRFRLRIPDTTWMRIVHSLVPLEYRDEFSQLLVLFVEDCEHAQIELISMLAAVEFDDAKSKLAEFSGNVSDALFGIISNKESLAKKEIKKRQKELALERENRIKKQKLGLLKSDALDIFNDKEKEKEAEKEAEKKNDESTNKMEVDADGKDDSSKKDEKDEKDREVSLLPLKERKQKKKFYPETYVYIHLLGAVQLLDKNDYTQSLNVVNKMIQFTKQQNRRTCDLLSSRLYQFQMLCYQRLGKISTIRTQLFLDYQTACIQQNEPVQSVLINNILQSYIHDSLYSLAHKFVEKAEFPVNSESQQFARYHYYRGRIDCIQLQYSDALFHTQQAIRRAPQTGANAFKVNSTRWLIVIHLLMGDIPDRSIFRSLDEDSNGFSNKTANRQQLLPFLEITEAVREGQLDRYRACFEQHHDIFQECGLAKVLMRLRHNVIKTGLRKINKSYSKISLSDIANKLNLKSAEDAYFIVGKAIKDSVISATIDYKNKFVESTQVSDVYSTTLPYDQFSTRVKFCLEIHDQAIKSLRYPAVDDDEKEEKGDFVTEEEVAEMIQKQLDRHNHDKDDDDNDN